MIKLSTIKTTTYELDDGFMLDVVTTETERAAWMYHKDTGVKMLMYSVQVFEMSSKAFMEMVETSVMCDHYDDFYQREFMKA